MNDDDFSSLVRSGTLHSVSVSEYTGDAKTPKNIITSRDEESEQRKRAFEQQELTALDANKRSPKYNEDIASHNLSSGAHTHEIEADTNVDYRQAIADSSPLPPNVQNVPTDVFNANVQKIDIGNIHDNIQFIHGDKGITPNIQNIAVDNAIEANRQFIDQERATKNIQYITPEAHEINKPKLTMQSVEEHASSIDNDKSKTPAKALSSTSAVAKPQQVTAQPAPFTTSEQQRQAKLKRDQMNDAFHARLAGIKNNVNTLNTHLTNFEEKAPKDDEKSDKGNQSAL